MDLYGLDAEVFSDVRSARPFEGRAHGKFAVPAFAVPEVASGQNRGDELEIVFK